MPASSTRRNLVRGHDRQTLAQSRFGTWGWAEHRIEAEELSIAAQRDPWPGVFLKVPASLNRQLAPLQPVPPLRTSRRVVPLPLTFVAELINLRTQLGALTMRTGQLSTEIAHIRKLTAEHFEHNEAQLIEMYTNLAGLAKLERDWDSYGASPPSVVAVGTAMQLLGRVYLQFRQDHRDNALPYAVSPFSGGIQIEWRSNDMALQIDVEEDGSIGGVIEDESTGVSVFEEYDSLEVENVIQLAQRVLSARVPA